MAYSDTNFNSMQQEAIRRVREMQKRSRSVIDDEAEPPAPAVDTKQPQQAKSNSSPVSSILGSLLGTGGSTKKGELFNIAGISIDEEKAMIGMLIYILWKQGADVKLLLALGYLLL